MTQPKTAFSARDRSPQEVIQNLREMIAGVESEARSLSPVISCGCRDFDQMLPAGGFVRGTLVEWLTEDRGTGGGSLSLIVARQASIEGGAVVVVDQERSFYPPIAIALGIDPAKLIVLRPVGLQDTLWTVDQSLRCSAVVAVWAYLDRVHHRAFRRLQLAAEMGQTLGLLHRPAHVRGQPSWSDMQIGVKTWSRQPICRMRVELIRYRGECKGRTMNLEIDPRSGELRKAQHVTLPANSMRVVSPLASSKARSRAS